MAKNKKISAGMKKFHKRASRRKSHAGVVKAARAKHRKNKR